jgi:hypothetical protein
MKRALFRLWISGLAGAAVLAASAAEPPAPNSPPDPAAAARRDIGKNAIEAPLKKAIAGPVGAPAAPGGDFINPKVEPGKVKWHADFEAARAAAAKSGKPVLLFQMMGNLDEQFC